MLAALGAAAAVSAFAAEAQTVAAMTRPAPTAALSAATRALFNAVRSHDLHAVKASVKDGADILATSDEGLTSLDLALAQGNFDIARYLMLMQTEKRTALTKRLAAFDAEREKADEKAEENSPPVEVAGTTPKVSIPLPPPPPKIEHPPASMVAPEPAPQESTAAEPPAPAQEPEPKLSAPVVETAPAPVAQNPEQTDIQPASGSTDMPDSAVEKMVTAAPAPAPEPKVEAAPAPETETPQLSGAEKQATPKSKVEAQPAPPPAPKRYHVIRRGETLTSIAARYGVTPQELIALNNIDRPDHILLGFRMYLPVSARDIPEEPLPPAPPPAPKVAKVMPAAEPAPRPAPSAISVSETPTVPASAPRQEASVSPPPAAPEPKAVAAPEPPEPAKQIAAATPAPQPETKPAMKEIETTLKPVPPKPAETPPVKESAEQSSGFMGFLSNLFGGNSNPPAADTAAEPENRDESVSTAAAPDAGAKDAAAGSAAAKPEPEPEPTATEIASVETAAANPTQSAPQIADASPQQMPSPPPIIMSRPPSPLPAAAPAEPPDAPLVEQQVAVQQLPPAQVRESAPEKAAPSPSQKAEEPAPETEAAATEPQEEPKQEPEQKPKEEPGFFSAMTKGFGKLFSSDDKDKKAEDKGKPEKAADASEPAQSPESNAADAKEPAKEPAAEPAELQKDGTISVDVQEIASPVRPPEPTAPVEQATMPPAVQQKTVVPTVASRTLNPFDPKNAPVGSTLPIVDPIGGDHPELGSVPIPKALPRIEISDANRIKTPPKEVVAAPAQEKAVAEPRIRLRPVPKTNFDHEPSTIENLMQFILPDNEEVTAKREIVGKRQKTASLSPPPVTNVRKPLVDADLTIGNLRPGVEKAAPKKGEREACVHRPGKSAEFCIVPVDWPDAIAPAFTVNTILYQGTRAIVRFDKNKATHIHALFNASDYRAVIQYFLDKYGQETDVWQRTIAPFNKPREPNPTRIWRSIDPDTKIMTVLEVRRYDDTRSTFPDVRHGVVRLYSGDAKKLFPTLSTLDIMTIDWSARADIPEPEGLTGDGPPALANTLPAQR